MRHRPEPAPPLRQIPDPAKYMRRPWFTTQPVDEAFFETAPVRLTATFEIRHPAPRVWNDLAGDEPLAWCRLLKDISWTSPPPHGVGSTRTARSVGDVSVINERFFRWEEGRRQSFYAIETSAPLFRRFGEDYLLEPTSERSCRFKWTIAFEPRSGARLVNPLNRRLLATLFRDTRRHYGLERR